MTTVFALIIGKAVLLLIRIVKKGTGSTWPGNIAMHIHACFIKDILKGQKIKVVLVIGTNGKTTTSRMLTTILSKSGKRVIQNAAGANLINGIASTLIENASLFGAIHADYAVFEVDELHVESLLQQITPDGIIILNLFRDQLDRYGELDSIAKRWEKAFAHLDHTQFILNGDDPKVSYLGIQGKFPKVFYFGLDEKTYQKVLSHAADSIYCPSCHTKLFYKTVYYSHLGLWQCPHCRLKRPELSMKSFFYPMTGTYNKYNTLAAALYAKKQGITESDIEKSIKSITPAFGRQEVIEYKDTRVQIFLSKNPTSFNESLQTIKNLGARHLVIVLNDRIPDGRDVSWIWDVDFETYSNLFTSVVITGDRVWDMSLRLSYTQRTTEVPRFFIIEPDLEKALIKGIEQVKKEETLYILPTYSAMLDVRAIVAGRKLL